MVRRRRNHEQEENSSTTNMDSFYSMQGDKVYISTGNLDQKLHPGCYTLNYNDYQNECYLEHSETTNIDATTSTRQMKEIIGICNSFITGIKSNSIANYGYKTKFGVLLEGPPGTGKSIITAKCVEHFVNNGGIAITITDEDVLNRGNGGEYIKKINLIQPDLPILIILEDLDSLDSYIEPSLTSILDGEQSPKNVLFFGTTNFCSNISERLKRPGRFDIIYKVEGMSKAVRKKYIVDKLADFDMKITKKQFDEYMEVTNDYNFAELRTFMAYIGIFGFKVKDIAAKLARSEKE